MDITYRLMLDRHPNKQGLLPIYFRCYREKKHFMVTTKLFAVDGEFSDGMFTGRNRREQQKELDEVTEKFDEFIQGYSDWGKTNTQVRDDALRFLFDKHRKLRTIVGMFDEYCERKKIHERTKNNYTSIKRRIAGYGDIPVEGCTDAWLEGLFDYLEEDGMSANSRFQYFTKIKAVIHYAYEEGYIDNMPYRKYKIKRTETAKRSLTLEEFRTLRDFQGSEAQNRARDLFLLEFYLCGINNVDLFELKELVDGRCQYIRHKTGKRYNINVPPEALEIIEKYKGKDHVLKFCEEERLGHGYFFQKVMFCLERMKIKKGITMYWARHSFASFAADLDIPMETISRCLGHSSGMAITQVYVKFNEKKIDAAQRMVIDYVNADLKEKEDR